MIVLEKFIDNVRSKAEVRQINKANEIISWYIAFPGLLHSKAPLLHLPRCYL